MLKAFCGHSFNCVWEWFVHEALRGTYDSQIWNFVSKIERGKSNCCDCSVNCPIHRRIEWKNIDKMSYISGDIGLDPRLPLLDYSGGAMNSLAQQHGWKPTEFCQKESAISIPISHKADIMINDVEFYPCQRSPENHRNDTYGIWILQSIHWGYWRLLCLARTERYIYLSNFQGFRRHYWWISSHAHGSAILPFWFNQSRVSKTCQRKYQLLLSDGKWNVVQLFTKIGGGFQKLCWSCFCFWSFRYAL